MTVLLNFLQLIYFSFIPTFFLSLFFSLITYHDWELYFFMNEKVHHKTGIGCFQIVSRSFSKVVSDLLRTCFGPVSELFRTRIGLVFDWFRTRFRTRFRSRFEHKLERNPCLANAVTLPPPPPFWLPILKLYRLKCCFAILITTLIATSIATSNLQSSLASRKCKKKKKERKKERKKEKKRKMKERNKELKKEQK